MMVRSKAPLRIGLAGGGTDVSPYSDLYGGAVLNASINLYAHISVEEWDKEEILIRMEDKNTEERFPVTNELELDGNLNLVKGVYNRIMKEFRLNPVPFRLSASVDAPPGSGLGSSSTLVVAILGAFSEWFRLPLGEYDIAWLAYDIERNDLGMAGGKQDQYAATFGGVNFMEFYKNDKVIVNPLRIKEQILNELSNNIVLYYTETSRLSSKIIETQQRNVKEGVTSSVDAMHKLKELAVSMKESILKGEIDSIGTLLNQSWNYKKQMAGEISNPRIDNIYETALKAGATGGKISGAGGGGYMFFYCPGNKRYDVVRVLSQFGGHEQKYEFIKRGLETWSI